MLITLCTFLFAMFMSLIVNSLDPTPSTSDLRSKQSVVIELP